MNDETFLEDKIPAKKIYADWAIWVGSFLGGPLVAAYFINENFKVFGEREKIWKTWVAAIAMTALVLTTLFIPLFDQVPGFFYYASYAITAVIFVRIFQRNKIDAHIAGGGKLFGRGRIIGISLLGGLIAAIPFFGAAYLAEGVFNTQAAKTYGTLNHEVQFDKNNITEAEVDKIADALTKTTFFDREKQKFVDVKKVDGGYELNIYCSETIKKDRGAVDWFVKLRGDMQKLFPSDKIVINLMIGTPDNLFKRLE